MTYAGPDVSTKLARYRFALSSMLQASHELRLEDLCLAAMTAALTEVTVAFCAPL
jgi:hypothetical protein